MKIDYTLYAFRNSSLIKIFQDIVKEMPGEISDLINSTAINKYVTGELIIYDLLVKNCVEKTKAAKAAVIFPEPLKYDPTILRTKDYKSIFEKLVEEKINPLEAIIDAVGFSKDVKEDFLKSLGF